MKKGILAKMNIISKGKLSKLVLLGVSVCLLFHFISCGKESPTEPEEPEKPTAIEGTVVGLIKGQPVKLSSVELCHDSGYVIDTCLIEGNTFRDDDVNNPQLVKRIRIRSDEAYDRETDLRLTRGANNVFTFNMIESDEITGFSFEECRIVVGNPSPRWKKLKPKHYLYDKHYFHGRDIAGEFTPSQNTLYWIKDVIMKDTPISSNGFVPNPVLERESLGHEHPPGGRDAEGYIIITFDDDIPDNVLAYVSIAPSFDFDIPNAKVMINMKYPNLPRWLFCEEINQTLGYSELGRRDYTVYSKDGFWHGDYLYPFDREYVNKIKYGRAPKNKTEGDIPDYDPPGSGTSGLIFYKVEPIYEPNPLNQFNQFQQPTFRLPKDKIHKKQILNKDLK